MTTPGPTLTVPMALLGAILLGFAIRHLVRLVRNSRLFDVPLAAETELRFTGTGPVVLHLEGPTLAMRPLPGLGYELHDQSLGRPVPSRRLLPSKIGGMSRTRWSIRRFEVEHLGSYRLKVTNLPPETDLTPWRLVFAKPLGAHLPLAILAIVAASLLLLFGTLLTFFRLTGVAPG